MIPADEYLKMLRRQMKMARKYLPEDQLEALSSPPRKTPTKKVARSLDELRNAEESFILQGTGR